MCRTARFSPTGPAGRTDLTWRANADAAPCDLGAITKDHQPDERADSCGAGRASLLNARRLTRSGLRQPPTSRRFRT